MAKVLLHSVAIDTDREPPGVSPDADPLQGQWEFFQGPQKLVTESFHLDPFKVHSITNDPEEADYIIFLEIGAQGLFLEWVRRHRFVKKYREKCFIFSTMDYTPAFFPGLFASLEKNRYNPARTRTGYYLRIDPNPFLRFHPFAEHPKYLACFVGTMKHHPVRMAMKQLPADRFLIEDATAFAQKAQWLAPEERSKNFWPHYAEAFASSAFALSPRGIGSGSIRLFEAMQMGRCPVILSDDWVFPERVNWAACSITVAEKDVARLPEILDERLSSAEELGKQARLEWEKYYAPSVRFHWLVEDCVAMREARRIPEAIAGRLAWLELMRPSVLIQYLRSKKQIYRKERRIIL
jgi:hypothetical protein